MRAARAGLTAGSIKAARAGLTAGPSVDVAKLAGVGRKVGASVLSGPWCLPEGGKSRWCEAYSCDKFELEGALLGSIAGGTGCPRWSSRSR